MPLGKEEKSVDKCSVVANTVFIETAKVARNDDRTQENLGEDLATDH